MGAPFLAGFARSGILNSVEAKSDDLKQQGLRKPEAESRKPAFKNVPRAPAHPTPAQAAARDRESPGSET